MLQYQLILFEHVLPSLSNSHTSSLQETLVGCVEQPEHLLIFFGVDLSLYPSPRSRTTKHSCCVSGCVFLGFVVSKSNRHVFNCTIRRCEHKKTNLFLLLGRKPKQIVLFIPTKRKFKYYFSVFLFRYFPLIRTILPHESTNFSWNVNKKTSLVCDKERMMVNFKFGHELRKYLAQYEQGIFPNS